MTYLIAISLLLLLQGLCVSFSSLKQLLFCLLLLSNSIVISIHSFVHIYLYTGGASLYTSYPHMESSNWVEFQLRLLIFTLERHEFTSLHSVPSDIWMFHHWLLCVSTHGEFNPHSRFYKPTDVHIMWLHLPFPRHCGGKYNAAWTSMKLFPIILYPV